MIDVVATELGLSRAVVWLLLAVASLQVAAQVTALIDLARRPRVRFDAKWVWVLVIVLFGNSFIGPILYLALGRSVPQALDVHATSEGPEERTDRTRRAVDALYGPDQDR